MISEIKANKKCIFFLVVSVINGIVVLVNFSNLVNILLDKGQDVLKYHAFFVVFCPVAGFQTARFILVDFQHFFNISVSKVIIKTVVIHLVLTHDQYNIMESKVHQKTFLLKAYTFPSSPKNDNLTLMTVDSEILKLPFHLILFPNNLRKVWASWFCVCVCVFVCVTVSCQALLSMIFFKARILAQVAICFSRGYSWPRDQTCISCIGRQTLPPSHLGNPPLVLCLCQPFHHVLLFAPPWTVAARLLCPGNSPGKSTAGGCHSLPQGIFLTQGLNPGLPHGRQILFPWATWDVHSWSFGHPQKD